MYLTLEDKQHVNMIKTLDGHVADVCIDINAQYFHLQDNVT